MKEHKKAIFKALKIMIPVILLIIAVTSHCLYTIDAMLCDVIYRQFDGLRPNIKIIGVDEETLTAYGTFEQWSREKSAELVETLYKDRQNAPMLTAFDFLFVSENKPEIDAHLAQVCNGKDIVFASNLVYRGMTKEAQNAGIYYDTWNIDMVEKPYPALEKESQQGYANNYIAKDGWVRYTKLKEQVSGNVQASFAWKIYELEEKKTGIDITMPETDQNGCVNFFYSGQVGEYPHFSMKDVLDGVIPASEFRNSIVLVGAYAPGLQDAYAVSADRSNLMYGVEIQANIVQALMDGKTAAPVKNIWYLLAAGSVLAFYFGIARKQKLVPTVLEGLLLCVFHAAIGRLLALHGHTITQIYFIGIIAVGILYFIIEKYFIEKIQRRKLLSSFKTYVAPQVVDQIAKEDDFLGRLGGEKREVAVLFVDIRGFTSLSENLLPEQVVSILNEYLKLTTTCILQNQGMLDKYIGDATMAVFNAPVDLENYVFCAVKAALDMQNGAAALTKDLETRFGKTVSFGIGINCGPAVIGNIGCSFRMDYTAIGDTVNTAARLESSAEPNEILVSENVYMQIRDRVNAEQVGEIELKGKSRKVMTYRILSLMEENDG